MRNAAMLWTGGKDSALALYEAMQSGYQVSRLVTFAPPEPSFLAHPIALMLRQAEALGLPHHVLTIRSPYEQAYEQQLQGLRNEFGLSSVITGDIASVAGRPNWIRERCRPLDLPVHTPLWGRDRESVLRQLLDLQFVVRFSCVNTEYLPATWAGRILDDAAIAELHGLRRQNGLDLCGEEGEYHTMVFNSPQFARALAPGRFEVRAEASLAYIKYPDYSFPESQAPE